jgi:hypothetical protein
LRDWSKEAGVGKKNWPLRNKGEARCAHLPPSFSVPQRDAPEMIEGEAVNVTIGSISP